MDWDTPQVEEYCSMVSLTLIGQGVSRIGRVLLDSVLTWALLWFPGWAWNRDQSPWVQLRQNTFLLAMLPKKPYGFKSCSLTYLILAWSLFSFIVTTRAISKYQRTLCFTIVRNTWRWDITIYVIWSSGELLVFGTYQLMSRPQMFSLSPYLRWSSSTSETSLVWWRMPLSLRGSVEVWLASKVILLGRYLVGDQD